MRLESIGVHGTTLLMLESLTFLFPVKHKGENMDLNIQEDMVGYINEMLENTDYCAAWLGIWELRGGTPADVAKHTRLTEHTAKFELEQLGISALVGEKDGRFYILPRGFELARIQRELSR